MRSVQSPVVIQSWLAGRHGCGWRGPAMFVVAAVLGSALPVDQLAAQVDGQDAAGNPAPRVGEPAAYRSRAVSREDRGVRVRVAVLSDLESLAVYGRLLARHAIQPIWVEVENRGARPLWLMSPGLDPEYFPASEAAEAFASAGSPEDARARERRFRALAFTNPVPPGATVSGFVLTRRHEGARLVQVDLFAGQDSRTFSMLAPVPGLRSDYARSGVFTNDFQVPGQRVDYADEATLRSALEVLPCCVTNKDGTKNGDPLNLVVVGGLDDAFPAFVRRGWSPTESSWTGSVVRLVRSTLARERYPYAPISNLYLFGRPQDIALQKARDNIHQRNHLRLWKSPMYFQGKPVWIGQVSRDIGSRLTIHSPTLTTHKIDPDVDLAAINLVSDMAYSQNLQMIGFVGGVGAAPRENPRRNLTTDPYFTTGMRAVLVFDRHPTPISGIEFLPWEADLDGTATAAGSGQPP